MRPNSQFPADLVRFTEEILNEKLHFCAVKCARFEARLKLCFLVFVFPSQHYNGKSKQIGESVN